MGISHIGRTGSGVALNCGDPGIHFAYLLCVLDLRNQDEVRMLRYDLFQIAAPKRKRIDSHHAFAMAEINRPQRVANQQARRIFLCVVHRVFEIENDAVGLMQAGIDEVLRLVAGQVKTRAPQAIASGWQRQRNRVGQCRHGRRDSGSQHGRFQPRIDDKRQRAFIHDLYASMGNAQRVQDVGSLYADRLAVVKVHARLQDNFDSTRISLFEADAQVGTDISFQRDPPLRDVG